MPSSKQSGRGGWRGLRDEATGAARSLAWWPLWLLLLLFVAALVCAYQSPRTFSVEVGTPADQAYVQNFHARLSDSARPYRWSDVYGYVDFPGLGGSRPFTMTVEVDPGRVAPVTLIVNGALLSKETLQPGWQAIVLRVDSRHPAALASRDTVLEIRAQDHRTPDAPTEPKGVKLGSVTVSEDPVGGFIVPPYARLILFAAAAALVYLFVWLALLGFATPGRARVWGLATAAILAVLLVLSTWGDRVATSAAAAHICITLGSMIVLFEAARIFIGTRRVTPGTARMAGVLVAVAFGLRYGGMALPQSVIIDMPWHMKWLRTLLSGDWQSLYFPGGLSSVPAEWGLDLLIPKSPLFYFVAAPLGVLPFELGTLVKWLSCFMDAGLVLPVFALTRLVFRSQRAGLMAAGLYGAMPLAFRAFSYGILPTIFAQWLATLTFVWLLSMLNRRASRLEWLGFTLLLCLSLLAFPTVAVFVSLILVSVAAVWWWQGRGARRQSALPAGIVVALLAAWVLAIVAYYGLYISPVVTSAAALLAPKPGGGSTVRWPGGFPELLGWTADYIVTVLPVILAATGIALLFTLRGYPGGERVRWFFLIWLSIFPVFLLVNLRVDMIGKHLFFTMVPIAVAGGAALLLISRRGLRWGTALTSLCLAAIFLQGLAFWIDRLLRASS